MHRDPSASTASDADGLLPGFADPVHGPQRAFRAILQAMARPGTIHPCGGALTPPGTLSPAMAAVALTLADADAPLWLAPSIATGEATGYLKFHCNAPIVGEPWEAAFVLADGGNMPALESCAQGCERYPDRGATLVVEVARLLADGPHGWTLRGPGIATTARLEADGLPADFPRRWADNAALFPCGVDLVLTCGDRLAALPRTTRLEG
jgi:alpha-D-ribose 1-methylphosphonate 5-triphosphate synthase subunit PhnH